MTTNLYSTTLIGTAIASALLAAPSIAVPTVSVSEVSSSTISGDVVYQNGAPVSGAAVYCYRIDDVGHAVAVTKDITDKTGAFHIAKDPSGSAHVKTIVFARNPIGIGFIAPGTHRITLDPTTSVRVHFEDQAGLPLGRLTVCPKVFYMFGYFAPWDENIPGDWTQVTDANGDATIPDLPQGAQLKLNILSDDYCQPGLRGNIVLATAGKTPDQNIALIRGGIVTGRILDQDTGLPVRRAYISVTEPDGADYPGTAVIPVDQNGRYKLTLAPGPHTLLPWVETGTQTTSMHGYPQKDVDVSAAQTKNLDFPIILPDPGATLQVHVIDPKGNPASGALVFACDEYDKLTSSSTDSTGTAVFAGLMSQVTLLASGAGCSTLTAVSAGRDGNVTLRLSQGGLVAFRGKIKAPAGSRPYGATVRLYRWSGDTAVEVDQAQADDRGNFSFAPNFCNFKYDVAVHLPGCADGVSNVVDAKLGQTAKFTPIILKAADQSIQGFVYSAAGQPMQNAEVRIVSNSAPTDPTTTDKSGYFKIAGIAGPSADVSITGTDGTSVHGVVPTGPKLINIRLTSAR